MNRLCCFVVSLLLSSSAMAAESHRSDTASEDSAKIYKSFLDSWTGREKHPLNVSIAAKSPSDDEIKQFSECAGTIGDSNWTRPESIDDLTGLIGDLSYVRLVDPEKWKPQDPGELIAQGKPVNSSVKSGFDNGLMTFSSITFDASRNTAAFTYSFVCGRLCGSGGTVMFARTPHGWTRSSKRCGSWISNIRDDRPNHSFKPTSLRDAA